MVGKDGINLMTMLDELGSTLQAAWPLLLAGLQMTLYVTSISLVIAMALGILVCLMRISKNVVLRAIAKFYVWIIRGTPMLVQAFYIYFAVPQLIQAATQSAFRIDIVTASLVTLTLNAGAYISEIFRGSIQAVDPGQMEASRSLGVSYATSMRKIILPQAVRICLPSLVNQCIITLKDSTIMYAVGLPEIMNQAKVYVGRTMDSFATYTWVALIFLAIISVLMILSSRLEKRMRA
jgi:amine acid ABC transporter, permease protein, 3-TM region, His/Glu/Gln/Arg/opine family